MEISLSKFQSLPGIHNGLLDSDLFRVDLPALSQVKGAFNVQTSGEFNCSQFDKFNADKTVKGKYVCTSKATNPGTPGSDPSATSTGGKSTKTGAAVHLRANMPIIVVGSSFAAYLLHFLL